MVVAMVVLSLRHASVLVSRQGGGARHELHVLPVLRYYYTAAAAAGLPERCVTRVRSFTREGKINYEACMAMLR